MISLQIRIVNKKRILIKKRKFQKSIFNVKIFTFKLFFHFKCPELCILRYMNTYIEIYEYLCSGQSKSLL
jgi:hypothetical protein